MPLRFLFALLTITASGYWLLTFIVKDLKKFSLYELIALTFGIGCGIINFQMGIMSLLKIKFSIGSLLLFQSPLHIIGVSRVFKKGFSYNEFKITKPSAMETVLLFLILFTVISVILEAISMPFAVWDSWSVWGYKATIIFSQRGIDQRIFQDFRTGGSYNPHYPLLFPLSEAYIWFFQGSIHEPSAKLFSALFFIALLAIFYCLLRKVFKRLFALGFTFLLSSLSPLVHSASIGYVDVPMAFYITTAVLYLWLYLRDADFSYFLLACLFLGIGMWTKNEGASQWIAVVASFLLLMWRKKIAFSRKNLFYLIAIPLAIYLPWIIFRISKGFWALKLGDAFDEKFRWGEMGRLPMILTLFIQPVVDVRSWSLLWLVFVMTILLSFKARNLFLLYFIALQSVLYVVVYFFWPQPMPTLQWNIGNSLSRTLSEIAPIVLFFIAQQLRERFMLSSETAKE